MMLPGGLPTLKNLKTSISALYYQSWHVLDTIREGLESS